MEEVDLARRKRLRRNLAQMQHGLDELARVLDPGLFTDLAAFQGDGRRQLGHGHGLHARGADEIDHGATEEPGQMQKAFVEPVDAGIVRIEAGVVVQIQAGEEAAPGHDVDDLAHEPMFERLGIFGPWPDPVVVRLAGQTAYPAGGGADVADEQTQRAREPEFAEAFEPFTQERAHGLPAHGLVAVQQHRDEERRSPRTGQMDERRRAEPFGESSAVGLQESVGQ